MQSGTTAALESPHKTDLRDTKDFRYECAAKIYEKILYIDGTYRLTAIHVSIILLAPLSSLTDGGSLDHTTRGALRLLLALENAATLVGHFLRSSNEDRRQSVCQTQPKGPVDAHPSERYPKTSITSMASSHETPDNDDTEPGGSSTEPEEIQRSTAAKNDCLERDNFKCLFTCAPAGEVAYILPFSWNKSEHYCLQTRYPLIRSMQVFFNDESTSVLAITLCNPARLDGSDQYRNMITMNDDLCSLWPQAFFGLKCLGIRPLDTQNAKVEIQFNWLKRRIGKPTDKIAIIGSNSMQEMAEEQIRYEDNNNPAPETHILINSGHIITLIMPIDDAKICKVIIDLQWHLIQIAAMSGGAEHPELLPKSEIRY
ncbi:hypothetical protein FPOA_03402 [Fusarium poae]|uniref:HNH nuclease domain-containing protein n=1 Tax=Fusarium poae TaxID=36050 RepID=A0A1B8B9R2_FUSPO|nr:hypothetical protein FPOA_03402 [Fusarium poae]